MANGKYDGRANLIPIKDAETARKLQKKSSTKQKENTKERLLIRKAIEKRLLESVTDEHGNEVTNFDKLIDTAIKRALEGDINFWTKIEAQLGQKPADKVEISKPDSEVIDEIDSYVKR